MGDHYVNDAIRAWAEVAKALAWPLAVVLLVRLFVRKYPTEIGELIRRVRKLFGSAEFAEGPQQASVARAESELVAGVDDSHFDQYLAVYRSNTAIQFETMLASGAALSASVAADVREKRLRTTAAILLAFAIFERIAGNIFGSQVDLLEFLNVQPHPMVPEIELKTRFYDRAAAAHPEVYGSYDFAGYLGYLLTNNLVKSDQDKIGLTERGKDYLVWRTQESKPKRAW
jgi:hypothetical protein